MDGRLDFFENEPIIAPVPLTAQLFEIQQALKVGGHMEEDHAAYVKYFEQLADVVVKSPETDPV